MNKIVKMGCFQRQTTNTADVIRSTGKKHGFAVLGYEKVTILGDICEADFFSKVTKIPYKNALTKGEVCLYPEREKVFFPSQKDLFQAITKDNFIVVGEVRENCTILLFISIVKNIREKDVLKIVDKMDTLKGSKEEKEKAIRKNASILRKKGFEAKVFKL